MQPRTLSEIAEEQGLERLSAVPPVGEYLREMWRRRHYAWKVPVGDWRSAHFDTLLGNLWHLLNPLFFIGVYYLVFGVLLDTRRDIDFFITYLAIGVFIFRYTQTAMETGAISVSGNEALIRSVYFPRALLPLSSVVYQTLVFLPSLAVIVVVALANGVRPQLTWFLVPLLIVWQGLFNFGGACVTARITDRFRDFPQLLNHFFRALFYLSAPMYSINQLVQNEQVRKFFHLNPVYAFLTIGRALFFGTAVSTADLVSALVWTGALVVGGFVFFRAAEPSYGRG